MTQTDTARARGLVGCRRCARAWPLDRDRCGLCGARLRSRNRFSLWWVWLWWGLGVLAYIPANLLPMLETRVLFTTSRDTILGGTWALASHGSFGIAAVIFFASVVIPVAKFAAIAWLALVVGRRQRSRAKWRHRVFEAVEWIGRWSMVDVFVVALLVSLVQLSVLATVTPGPAALAFAMSVIFTMVSALSFDSRMIWDLDAPPDRILASEGQKPDSARPSD